MIKVGKTFIGASQGHSFKIDPDCVHSRTPTEKMPVLVHGTRYVFLQSILQHGIRPGGLREGHRQMVHCLKDDPSSAKFYLPGVDVVQKTDAIWYRSENGYYMTSETVPAKAIQKVSVVGSSDVVYAEGDRPPDLKAVAKAVLRVQSKGSRISAPARSSATHASGCHRNATPAGQAVQLTHVSANMTRQDPDSLEHITGRAPRGPLHGRNRLSFRFLRRNCPVPYCGGKIFTRSQICLMFCSLLCLHHWIGMVHVKANRRIYVWVTVRLGKGLYRRRRCLQLPQIREESSHEASPTNSHIHESRTGPKPSSHRQQARTHLFVLMMMCITHKTGATRGVAEARVVTDASAVTGAVSRLTTGMPAYSENTGEAGRSLANGLKWTAKRALRRARARAEKEGGARYRGRWYTAEQLRRTRQGVAPMPTENSTSRVKPATSANKQGTGKNQVHNI